MRSQKVTFENAKGEQLAARLELPVNQHPHTFALFAHCFTCTKNLTAVRNLSRALSINGIAVLRFDFTGLGESEGDFADTSFSSNLDDLEDAARWLGEHYAPPQLLVGHSLGGTAVLAVAERLESVRAVATLGAPATPEHVLKHFGSGLERIEEEGSAEVALAGRTFRVRRDFVEDTRRHPLPERLASLRRALLVLHSPVDNVVAVDQAQKIFVAAKHPKSFVSLDDADHLLSRTEDSAYAGGVIAAWASRFLALSRPEPVPGAGVSGLTADGFLCRVQAGRHALVADEPGDKGGADEGPDPYQFLAAALGSCTVMTLNMYARHKKLPVTRVRCEVSHRRVHADDCADCESTGGHVHELSRVIDIEGELEASQRKRMLQIADRCPVHRTLEGEIRIRSRLAD